MRNPVRTPGRFNLNTYMKKKVSGGAVGYWSKNGAIYTTYSFARS